jgi:cytochrome b561
MASERYSTASIALHWITLLLIIGVYACMELREYWPKGDPIREGLKSWHFTLGLTVFVLTLARIAARLGRPAPPIIPTPPAWQTALTKIVHLALYALLIAMPIGGWLILSALNKEIPFWFVNLPPLVSENKDLAEFVEEIHETAGKAGYFLIGLHAAAAIFHHRVMKDNTLARMLPGGKRERGVA